MKICVMNKEEMRAFGNGSPNGKRYGGLIKRAYVLEGGCGKNSKTWARKKPRNYNRNSEGEGERNHPWILGIVLGLGMWDSHSPNGQQSGNAYWELVVVIIVQWERTKRK